LTAKKLRVIGTSVTLHESVQNLATRDLGFEISFEVLDGLACQQRGVMQPESFDVYDQWFHSVDLLWTAGSIQSIDTTKITQWSILSALTKRSDFKSQVKGSHPADVIFVQPNNSLSDTATKYISMLPTTFNVDSFAYVADEAKHGTTESWSWLLDDAWHGRLALSRDPASSIVELALAATSAGLMEADNVGNLTIEEINRLFDVLGRLKKKGHFNKSWISHEESVRQFILPSTAIGSIWSPAYYEAKGLGRNLKYASPKEGYRGWHSGLCLSAAVSNEMREKAYNYFNWWLSGAPGAIMARQGYYMSVIEPMKQSLSQEEWDFWYDGQPASKDLNSLHGETAVLKGETRPGGSYETRISNIAAWSTIMDEHNYIVRRWREFLD
jgi:putative spermidine/putrescine transport system substrate-binding protein